MPAETYWTLVGAAAAVLTSFGFVPQVIKMWRSGSVGDVSPLTFYQFTAGVILWALYGLSRGDPVVVAANVVTLATLIAALSLYHRARIATAQALVQNTFRAALGIGADALITVRDSAHGLVLGVARSGGDIADVARGVLNGAIAGAKRSGMASRSAAMAAATGIIEAAVDIGPEAVYVVSREFISRASRTGGDLPVIARETVEKAGRHAQATGADAALMTERAAAGALDAARTIGPQAENAVRAALP